MTSGADYLGPIFLILDVFPFWFWNFTCQQNSEDLVTRLQSSPLGQARQEISQSELSVNSKSPIWR